MSKDVKFLREKKMLCHDLTANNWKQKYISQSMIYLKSWLKNLIHYFPINLVKSWYKKLIVNKNALIKFPFYCFITGKKCHELHEWFNEFVQFYCEIICIYVHIFIWLFITGFIVVSNYVRYLLLYFWLRFNWFGECIQWLFKNRVVCVETF